MFRFEGVTLRNILFTCACVCVFQSLLAECVAPHVEDMGMITATASAGNPSYICKMFRSVSVSFFLAKMFLERFLLMFLCVAELWRKACRTASMPPGLLCCRSWAASIVQRGRRLTPSCLRCSETHGILKWQPLTCATHQLPSCVLLSPCSPWLTCVPPLTSPSPASWTWL